MSNSINNQRFIDVYFLLVNQKKVKNKTDFARKLGIHPQIIYDIFANKLRISSDILVKLEKEYLISKSYILFGEGDAFIESEISNEQPSILNEPSAQYRTNLSNDVDLREIFEMMKKLVDSNAKLSEGIENVTQSNKILAQNSNKIADSIHQITESNAELTHTNHLLAQSNAELVAKYAGRGMDAKDAKVADVG